MENISIYYGDINVCESYVKEYINKKNIKSVSYIYNSDDISDIINPFNIVNKNAYIYINPLKDDLLYLNSIEKQIYNNNYVFIITDNIDKRLSFYKNKKIRPMSDLIFSCVNTRKY